MELETNEMTNLTTIWGNVTDNGEALINCSLVENVTAFEHCQASTGEDMRKSFSKLFALMQTFSSIVMHE